MKTILQLLYVLLLSLLACKNEQPSDITKTPAVNAYITDFSYFPLQVGNEWIYEVDADTVKLHKKVTGTTKINNQEYYILTYNQYQYGGRVSDDKTMYLRSPDGLKIIKYEDSSETLFRDFSDNITDESYLKEYTTTSIPSMDTPMGKFNDCKKVEDVGIEYDAGCIYFYAKGIGLIKQGWFRGEFRLIKATINNHTY